MWKYCFVSVLVVLVVQNVDGAMRKSWKSQANFETEVPKFTPFVNVMKDEAVTEAATVPTTKISAKIKAPEKHIAELYSQMDSQKVTHDFGSFAYQVPETSSEEEELNNEIPNKLLSNNFSHENEDDEDEEFEFFSSDDATQYKVGNVMNVSVNADDQIVNVNLDQHSLKEIFTGRGRKHSMLERVVPLFIIPFLIQAAIIPFMVTTIKLFLLKSLFAGKVAILFFLLGALKSHQNSLYMKNLQNPPPFFKDYPSPYLPERRIETSFDGYKVDGRPEAFIN